METSKARIAIMGAGAIGSVIGGMLARKGHNVTLVGRKAHMDAIAENGLQISGIWGEHTVLDIKTATAPPEEHQDIIFLTVKSFDTEKAGKEALLMTGPETVIVSIQNGLGNVETLIEIAGKDKIIGGMAIFGATIIEPGSVRVTVIASETLVGEIDGSNNGKVKAIARLLDSAGIPTKTSENIMRDIWHKALYNIALNPLSAIFQVPYGEIADNPHTRWLAEQMIREAFMVAEASGQDLGLSRDEYLDILWNRKLPPTREHKSSMLQDITRGKRTEIDHINGAIVRLGAEYSIETPYNSAIVSMVRARETLGKKQGENMDIELIDFEKEMEKLQSPRRPHDMVTVGDSVLRAVRCEGEGKWYIHDYDEFFLHYKGEVIIESDNSGIILRPGAGVLVPAGVRHRTNSKEKAIFMVFRHKQTACMLA